MTRTVTATEAKNRLGALLRVVSEEGEEVIVENRGEPVAVFLPMAGYDEWRELREEARRRAIWERLRCVQAELDRQNSDLSTEEAQELVDRISRDTMDALVADGKVRFEE
jgi:prevent-host-death family protein